MNVNLRAPSSDAWLRCVLDNFDEFLIDHAANERKASAMAMSLLAHYPDKAELVSTMADLAIEELSHFRLVIRLMRARGLVMTPDEKDPYVNRLRAHVRRGRDEYFLDRLICAAVIEARGEERFRRLAAGLQEETLKAFYSTLARSEGGHHLLFLRLATVYFPVAAVRARLEDWLAIEDGVMGSLPVRSRLH